MKLKLIFMAIDALFIALTVSMGYTFRHSKGFAASLLPVFRKKTAVERAQYDEEALCKDVGSALLTWAVFFILAVVVDAFIAGVGFAIGVILTVIGLFLLRRKMSHDFAYWRKKS